MTDHVSNIEPQPVDDLTGNLSFASAISKLESQFTLLLG